MKNKKLYLFALSVLMPITVGTFALAGEPNERTIDTTNDSKLLEAVLKTPGTKKIRVELPDQDLTVEVTCCDPGVGCCGMCCKH